MDPGRILESRLVRRHNDLSDEFTSAAKHEAVNTDHADSDAIFEQASTIALGYVDRSNIPAPILGTDEAKVEVSDEVRLRSFNPNPNNKDKRLIQFPVRLHRMLERIEQDGYGHVVSWQLHGRCFVVHNPASLEQLLPIYFPGIWKFSSFQRQVRLFAWSLIFTDFRQLTSC
jgi:HSF-type DNA-binding